MGNDQINNYSNLYDLMDKDVVNHSIICHIHSIKKSNIEDYFQLSLLLDNEINNQFLVDSNFFEDNFKNMNEVKGIKLEIIQFQFINIENNIFMKILKASFNKKEKIEIEQKIILFLIL